MVIAIGGIFGPTALALEHVFQVALMGPIMATLGAGTGGAQPTSPPQQGAFTTPGKNRPAPAGYRPARPPVPKDVVAKALEVLHSKDPIGTHVPATIGGKDYIFAIEWHKHAQTDKVPENLKNWHRGVTVYEPK